jgi:hypothetical protein
VFLLTTITTVVGIGVGEEVLTTVVGILVGVGVLTFVGDLDVHPAMRIPINRIAKITYNFFISSYFHSGC